MLTVLRSLPERTNNGTVRWECVCSCGKIVARASIELLRQPRGKQSIPKSCGCARIGRRSARYSGAGNLSGQKWANIRNGASRREIEFTVTVQEVWNLYEAQNRRCTLTGLEITLDPRSMAAGANTASLDRIDSLKGYVSGNVQWVHVVINLMKQTLSNSEFIEWCSRVQKHNNVDS